MVRTFVAWISALPNKGMKLTSVEPIGRSQLIPSVRPTVAKSHLTAYQYPGTIGYAFSSLTGHRAGPDLGTGRG